MKLIALIVQVPDTSSENLALKGEVEELVKQVQQLSLPGGPILADREVKRLQQQLRCLEDSFWQKDQQCARMHRHKMGYIRQIGRLRALFIEAKDVIGRARSEAHNHAHNRCTVGRPTYHAPQWSSLQGELQDGRFGYASTSKRGCGQSTIHASNP